MRTNSTNFQHVAYGLAIQAMVFLAWLPFAILFGFPVVLGAWAGAFTAGAAFISREHAHKQVDIKETTGTAIEQQNPIDGFDWRGDDDRQADALFPNIACFAAAILATALL